MEFPRGAPSNFHGLGTVRRCQIEVARLVQTETNELPNNIEAEQSVIGSILISNEIFDEINMRITSKNFYDPMHQKIFSAIEKLIYSGMLANPITLKNHFENEKDELNVPDYLVKITQCEFVQRPWKR